MKKLLSSTILAFLLVVSTGFAAEQDGFRKDNLYVGPTLGYCYILGGSLSLGARAEYDLMDGVKLGTFNGSIGLGAEFYYSSYSDSYLWGEWSYTLFGILFYASYHFSPENTFDPYVRAGLGFNNISSTWTSASGYSESWGSSGYGSGLGYDASIGFYFHITNALDLRADLGYPVLLSAGIDFNLGDMGWQKKEK